MKKQKTLLLLCNLFCCILLPLSAQKPATNPVIYADAPDMSMLRVGKVRLAQRQAVRAGQTVGGAIDAKPHRPQPL